MADLKISQLTSATLPLAGTEVLPIVQSSSTKKVATDDLTVKNVRSNATTGILQVAGPATAATRIMTVPDANFTAARTDAAQSFTGDQTLGTGNLIQGTAAKGIDFTANTPAAGMTSELLNWYEEGTWTPTVVGSTTAGTQTYTWQYGKYTRIGNMVTLNFSVRVATTASMAGNVRIGGLPFTGIAGQINAGGAAISDWGNFINNSYVFMSGVVPAAATYLELSGATAATTSTGNVAVNSITGGSFIDGTITYFV